MVKATNWEKLRYSFLRKNPNLKRTEFVKKKNFRNWLREFHPHLLHNSTTEWNLPSSCSTIPTCEVDLLSTTPTSEVDYHPLVTLPSENHDDPTSLQKDIFENSLNQSVLSHSNEDINIHLPYPIVVPPIPN